MKKKMPKLGQVGDYIVAVGELNGYLEFEKALRKFYENNKDVNPVFLHYVVTTESSEVHLDEILNNDEEKL